MGISERALAEDERLVPGFFEGCEGAKGSIEASVDVCFRVPVERTCCEGGVYAATKLFSWLGRAVVGGKIPGRDTH